MRAPAHPRHGENTHFCARCLTGVDAGVASCPSCRAVFAAAEPYHLPVETTPVPLFALFFLRRPQRAEPGDLQQA